MSTLITLIAQASDLTAQSNTHSITPLGIIIMILAIGGMTTLLSWCIYKVVSVPEAPEHLHTQSDITPPDELEERQ
ncbi:hypothetical protein KS4_12610 [Poriferisphaera corsica]|uniref:Uncharacterized protein n=1 Tax=Poriferisphaera corsica TaxID=2528020 RepID=A0A517YSL1_9BACT|nr:hypothetical protein [Poriferisphaera corsica]QDU33216.1 hypothetical protein KS4_12610 [Poriferisphaera corsica]